MLVKRFLKMMLAALGMLAACAGAVRGYMVWDRSRDKLPEFRAPDLTHRAPTGENALYGINVGVDSRASIGEWLSRQHISCRDTSMRALMVAKRDQIAGDMARAKSRGEDPDIVSGASMLNYRSKSEQNPQLRLSCEGVAGAALPGTSAPTGMGRLLIILDSVEHPVRHVSYAYHLADNDQVLAAWNQSVQKMMRRLGSPTSVVASDPLSGDDFQPGRLFKREWLFGDLRAEVTALRIGRRPVGLRETIEVPWPVQSDAPTLLSQPAASARQDVHRDNIGLLP